MGGKRGYFSLKNIAGQLGEANKKAKVNEVDKIYSKEKGNATSVTRNLANEMRVLYPMVSETATGHRVPNPYRAAAFKAGDVWLQGPEIHDKDAGRAFLLDPAEYDLGKKDLNDALNLAAANTFVSNNSTNVLSTPTGNASSTSSSSTGAATPGIGSVPMETGARFNTPAGKKPQDVGISEEEESEAKIKGFKDELVLLESQYATANKLIYDTKMAWLKEDSATRKSADEINAEGVLEQSKVETLKRKIDTVSKDLDDAKADFRTLKIQLKVTEEKFQKVDYKKFQDECNKFIGYLLQKCDASLLDHLNGQVEFQRAQALNDAVKVSYLIKHYCLDAESENVYERCFERSMSLRNTKMGEKQTIAEYAMWFMETYREYNDLGGTDAERDFVTAICMNINRSYESQAKEWMINSSKTRPANVTEAFDKLKLVESRWVGKAETREVVREVVSSPKKALAVTAGKPWVKQGSPSQSPRAEKKFACNNWNRTGACSYGDTCIFAHNGTPNVAQGTAKNTFRICSKMLQQGVCSKGDDCTRVSCHASSKEMYDQAMAKQRIAGNKKDSDSRIRESIL